jgi:uncharacterized membrane protein YdfJ with MMPL/SSD domain
VIAMTANEMRFVRTIAWLVVIACLMFLVSVVLAVATYRPGLSLEKEYDKLTEISQRLQETAEH